MGLSFTTAIGEVKAKFNNAAKTFFSKFQQVPFFDIVFFKQNITSHNYTTLAQCYLKMELDKKLPYEERGLELELGM